MKLGDKIKLHWEKKGMFSDSEPTIVDGEFIVIGVSRGMPHCFGKNSWSQGFNSFEYAEVDPERPDLVRRGSVYVPDASYLDKKTISDLTCYNKTVSWEIIDKHREGRRIRQ